MYCEWIGSQLSTGKGATPFCRTTRAPVSEGSKLEALDSVWPFGHRCYGEPLALQKRTATSQPMASKHKRVPPSPHLWLTLSLSAVGIHWLGKLQF